MISELIVLYLMKGHLEYFSIANNGNKFGLNTDGSFQYLLSILGQFPAFLSHTTVQGGFIYHCPLELPLCEALYWSFLWIGRAWHSLTVTYHPHLHDHHVHIGTVTYHQHQGVQSPSWVTGRQLSWGALLSRVL